MKVSREQMAENRKAILRAAGRLFRERGFDAVSVAEVMSAAGFTHGGFYRHFGSKDELIAETLAALLEPAENTHADFKAFLASYLSPRHRDNPGDGCPTAGLAADTRHQRSDARAVMTSALNSHIERMSKRLGGKVSARKREAATGTWAAMVGAVILSRAVDDPALSDRILKDTREWLSDQAR